MMSVISGHEITDDAIACEEQKVTALDYVSCVLFCSSHAMTSSVIYYSTETQKNEIYLLKTQLNLQEHCLRLY